MISLADLVDSVLEKTREGKLMWKEFLPGSYETATGGFSFIIERDGALYTIRVTDHKREIERLSPASSALEINKKLGQIYESARRQALRVDDTLLDLKRRLENL